MKPCMLWCGLAASTLIASCTTQPLYHVVDLGPRSVFFDKYDENPLAGTPFEKHWEKRNPKPEQDFPPEHFYESLVRIFSGYYGSPLPSPAGGAEAIDSKSRVGGWAQTFAGAPGGSLQTTDRAVLYAKGNVYDIGAPPGGNSSVLGMNDRLQLVGTHGPGVQAFHWNGLTNKFETLFPDTSVIRFATDINNAGTIVGHTSGGFPISVTAFRTVDGALQELPKDSWYADARDISNNGTIVGQAVRDGAYQAVRWTNGAISYLPESPSGSDMSAAYAINESGVIVGSLRESGATPTRAVFWPLIGFPLMLTNQASEALDINETNQVVGWALNADGESFAFIYSGGNLRNLNAISDVGESWTLDKAVAINDSGRITGEGTLNGEPRVFLLVPWGQLYTTSTETVTLTGGTTFP